jgi:L-ascorbate metabolism protein UlaG (beta-lactamase superfamily)
MIITYYGLSCVKIQSGDIVLAVDPFTKESGATPPRFQANIVLLTDSATTQAESITGEPFVVDGPGEFELKGITIDGLPAKNTPYIIEWDDIRICHLGSFPDKELTKELISAIRNPDILIVPVGGGESPNTKQAISIVNQIDPRVIIPVQFKVADISTPKLGSPDEFLKEFNGPVKPEEKYVFKKKDLPTEGISVIYLSV